MIDYAIARENMIESQVRPNGITDRALIEAMEEVPRELFVPEDMKSLAYMDEDVPLATGADGRKRYLIEPMAFARMVQAAGIHSDDIVLDVGCGAGYSTAVLSKLAQLVIGVDSNEAFVNAAQDNLLKLVINNAVVFNSSPKDGHPSEAPYNVIIINGRVDHVPETLLSQLAEGGRLVAVAGDHENAQAMVYTKADGVAAARYAFDASIPVLPGFEKPDPGFVF
jgi:protein-L-isoaspartate(D-aspartate) O-methyltransferase